MLGHNGGRADGRDHGVRQPEAGVAWPSFGTLNRSCDRDTDPGCCLSTLWSAGCRWFTFAASERVGPLGTAAADRCALKLLTKEIISPSQADKSLFFLAPMVILMPALAAWAVIPFGPGIVLSDINAGLLYVMAITSVGVYGVIIAGWASNSKYAFQVAMRAAREWSATRSDGVRAGLRCDCGWHLNLRRSWGAEHRILPRMGLNSVMHAARCCRCSDLYAFHASLKPPASI